MMHQTILAMLGLASCALILVAFWGSDLLGNKWRRQRQATIGVTGAAWQAPRVASGETLSWA